MVFFVMELAARFRMGIDGGQWACRSESEYEREKQENHK
jgi:hypothetical protein